MGHTYVEAFEVGHVVVAHLAPIDQVLAILGVGAHRPGARAAVEAFADLFGGEAQAGAEW